MKRLHVHVSVEDLDRSIGFYATLFGSAPAVVKGDYAKWMLEDPRVNFAISTHGAQVGVDHLGIQVDEAEELTELSGRLKAAGETTFDQENATCCYARSDKAWVSDPAGLRWETFHTFGEAVTYGEDDVPAAVEMQPETAACCGPAPKAEPVAACC
ncbi:ArsI/CadI family heavy metal resistance metalloenzyme [Phenylobacterium sp.]|uniref:ArsI/CadI family heavy metal resistance metalloenzyme n=1 Tax=Phenylobacterium sp. TaxID=1871053 RepID=UPI00273069AF|nr:ArsI/CadI family heavy metal resistance metalloenzyme [Phenylobacterium sp.]MDP1874928.1 ArsI/CadI family heavy metal resistance metalloenzyme [Phenylobacterium sp.]MDP3491177.1 ArsI/CadI family heavy metal resistance metalloenzyme [Phenylobacterium sp.]